MAGTDVAARQPSHERMVTENSACRAETRNLRRKERPVLTASRGGFHWAPRDSIGLPKRTHGPHPTRCFRYDILYKPWNTVGITKGAVKMRGLEGTCMLLKPWDSDQSQTQLRSKKAATTLAFVVRIHVCSYTLGVFPFFGHSDKLIVIIGWLDAHISVACLGVCLWGYFQNPALNLDCMILGARVLYWTESWSEISADILSFYFLSCLMWAGSLILPLP